MRIRFSVFCRTEWGRQVYLLGSQPEMGGFDSDRAVKMSYSPEDVWSAEILLAEGAPSSFEYTYIIKSEAGNLLREEAWRRPFVLDAGGTEDLEFQDAW